jgi:dethiobiotin synthetase
MTEQGRVFCISGIDTDIGKTIVTGLLAGYLVRQGLRTITQKIVQTGCTGISQDILRHRQIMGSGILDEDRQGLTCPYVFATPCSPHLAARLAGQVIDCALLGRATDSLRDRYDVVLLEGAGGLHVPLTDDVTVLDYIGEKGYPVILVTSPRLGSINHTVTALELLHNRGIEVRGLVYNRFQGHDPRITADSAEVFMRFLVRFGFPGCLVHLDPLPDPPEDNDNTDFSCLFQ